MRTRSGCGSVFWHHKIITREAEKNPHRFRCWRGSFRLRYWECFSSILNVFFNWMFFYTADNDCGWPVQTPPTHPTDVIVHHDVSLYTLSWANSLDIRPTVEVAPLGGRIITSRLTNTRIADALFKRPLPLHENLKIKPLFCARFCARVVVAILFAFQCLCGSSYASELTPTQKATFKSLHMHHPWWDTSGRHFL